MIFLYVREKLKLFSPPPTGTATLTSELYTFYIESSGGLLTEFQSGSSSTVSIIADGGTALNSVKDGDIIIGVASFTFSDPMTPGGVSLGGGTISSTIRLISLNPGAVDPAQSRTISYNTSPGLINSGTTGSAPTTSGGTISYQWEQSDDNTAWSDTPGANSASYTSPSLTTSTYFRRKAIVITSLTTRCSSTTNAIQITVSPATNSTSGFNITSFAVSETFCTGEVVTFTASGSTSYEFLVNGTVTQARSTVQTFTTVLTANSSVTVIGNTTTQTATFNMYYNEVQAGTIFGTQSICYGEPATLTLETHGSVGGIPLTGLGTGFYQWQSSLDRISWSDVPSATSVNLTVPSLVLSTYFRLNTVNRLNGVLCTDPSDWVEVTVAPNLLGGTIDQSDYILCAGDIPQELTVSGGSSGASILYQWQKSVDGGTTYTDISFETNPNFIASSVTETTSFRRVTYSALRSCTIMSNDLQVTFDDILPGSLDPSQDSAICYNSIPPLISNGATGMDATSSVGTITYQWQQSINNLIWADLSSGNLSYYTPTQVITQTTWFRRQGISTTGTLTCSDTTNAIQFLVYDEIIPGNTTGDQTICEDDVPATLNLLCASTDLGLTHQWQNSLDNIVFANIPNTGTSLPFTALYKNPFLFFKTL